MDCPNYPETNLGEWGRELLNRLNGKRYPLSATFELTERCNLKCVHCFINQPSTNKAALNREMTLVEIKSILDHITEAGTLNLLLTGGEVLLRRDFMDIYHHAKMNGLLLMIFTNATLVTPRIADFLAEYPPLMVEVSIYGDTPETYEQVTKIPGSYARSQRGIQLLHERHLPLGLKSMVLTINRHELQQMAEFANQLGVSFRYDAMLMPRLNQDLQPYIYCLTPEQIVALDDQDLSRKKKWHNLSEMHNGNFIRQKLFNCGAGYHGFHINSAGQMSVCMMARYPAYNLLGGSFQEGWRFLDTVRGVTREYDTACVSCNVGVLCTQCPGWSQMVHGDNETPVEFVCQVGKLRANQFFW